MLPSLNLLLAYFRKTAFPFSNTGWVQSSGGSEQQQLSVNGSFVSVWRCLLEASYSPAPGSARSPVFSLNVNIRPHWAPGESHTSKIRLHIFLSDQLYEVRAGSGDPERSALTILFTSTRTQVKEILVSDGDSWFFCDREDSSTENWHYNAPTTMHPRQRHNRNNYSAIVLPAVRVGNWIQPRLKSVFINHIFFFLRLPSNFRKKMLK